MYDDLSKKAFDLYDELAEDFEDDEIMLFLEDGYALEGYEQETIEELYNYLKETIGE